MCVLSIKGPYEKSLETNLMILELEADTIKQAKKKEKSISNEREIFSKLSTAAGISTKL